MKLLITGATGFIGQHLLENKFFTKDNIEIRILSRKDNPVLRFSQNIKSYKGDLSEISTIENAFSGIDIVINLAAELKDNDKFDSTNILGTKNIISMMKKYNVKNIIHLSSVGVVGKQYSFSPVNITEATECFPKNNYEISKLESEKIFIEAAKKNNFDLIILRPTNVFGEFHPKLFLLNFMNHLKNHKLILYSNNAVVNYVYVKDVTNAIIHFVENNYTESIYNIGKSMKLTDFIHSTSDILSVKPSIYKVPAIIIHFLELTNYFGINSFKNKFHSISNAVEYNDNKIESIFGYEYGIEAGLKNIFDFYKTNGKL